MFNLLNLIPRLLHRKTGREPGRFIHVPRDVACVVLCVVLIIELLPTQSDSKYCPALKNAIVVAGTYGSAVLLFKLLAGYRKFSFHQGIVAPKLFSGFYNERSRRSLSESAGCCSLWQQGVLRRLLWTTVSSKNKFNKAVSCLASTKLIPQPFCCMLVMWPSLENCF